MGKELPIEVLFRELSPKNQAALLSAARLSLAEAGMSQSLASRPPADGAAHTAFAAPEGRSVLV
jgi:hypothetical protein